MSFAKEWCTTEINPEEIATALNGELVERTGLNSSYDIHLRYGRRRPVTTLVLNPPERTIFIALPGPIIDDEQTYRFTVELSEIESINFFQHKLRGRQRIPKTDMLILVRNETGNVSSTVISSHYHLNSISLPKTP